MVKLRESIFSCIIDDLIFSKSCLYFSLFFALVVTEKVSKLHPNLFLTSTMCLGCGKPPFIPICRHLFESEQPRNTPWCRLGLLKIPLVPPVLFFVWTYVFSRSFVCPEPSDNPGPFTRGTDPSAASSLDLSGQVSAEVVTEFRL